MASATNNHKRTFTVAWRDHVTCYGGSEHHGDGEQVPVREVGEVVMLERLTWRLVTVGHHITSQQLTCIHQNNSKKQSGIKIPRLIMDQGKRTNIVIQNCNYNLHVPINLRCLTKIFVVTGASLGNVSRACFCFSSNFCPSKKYFFKKAATFDSKILLKGCFILEDSKTN